MKGVQGTEWFAGGDLTSRLAHRWRQFPKFAARPKRGDLAVRVGKLRLADLPELSQTV